MLNRLVMCFLLWFIVNINCYSQSGNPPFLQGLYLRYKNANLVIGYSTIAEVYERFGDPEKSEVRRYGGEDFFWENMIINTYFAGRLRLIFSIEKKCLIQVIFLPSMDDEYTFFGTLNQKSNRSDILAYFSRSNYKYTTVQTTIWVDYYASSSPSFNVMAGFQFKEDQTLYALNFHTDGPWDPQNTPVFSVPTHKTTDNLRLRENSDIFSVSFLTLPKNTEVQVLETGPVQTIDKITAPWVKVITADGYIGWCFSGYLQQL